MWRSRSRFSFVYSVKSDIRLLSFRSFHFSFLPFCPFRSAFLNASPLAHAEGEWKEGIQRIWLDLPDRYIRLLIGQYVIG